jgi:hypothetical protein
MLRPIRCGLLIISAIAVNLADLAVIIDVRQAGNSSKSPAEEFQVTIYGCRARRRTICCEVVAARHDQRAHSLRKTSIDQIQGVLTASLYRHRACRNGPLGRTHEIGRVVRPASEVADLVGPEDDALQEIRSVRHKGTSDSRAPAASQPGSQHVDLTTWRGPVEAAR